MSQKFWVFSLRHSVFYRILRAHNTFQEIENAGKIYNVIDFCFVSVNTVIEYFFLVETATDSED
jgi:hypothetical protein